MVDSVLRVPNLRGLILETFGAGNAPKGEDGSLTSVIRAAVERKIVVVNVSQCYSGTVSPLYAPATILGRAGVVFGHDLTTEAALTKLSFLLALPGLSYEDIIMQMTLSLRGEMTEIASPQFTHPYSDEPTITPEQTALTALGHAITEGDRKAVLGLLSVDKQRLLNARDYTGNNVLHLAAIGPDPEILRDLLLMGASVHVRNKARNTPLFLAQRAGLIEHVELLTKSGAHLHVEEIEEWNLK
jgi:lysophospholipase